MTEAPVISTARLRLRGHVSADFDAYAMFLESNRATHMGRLSRNRAWYSFCAESAAWGFQGHGAWAIETLEGRFIGQVALLKPPAFPELELGWFLLEARDEGQGYAAEAARAAMGFARETMGRRMLVSYVGPDNLRSQALAERLGATRDLFGPRPHGDDCIVYRHDLTGEAAA